VVAAFGTDHLPACDATPQTEKLVPPRAAVSIGTVEAAEVERLITRYNDAWNRHDLDAISSLHSPAIVFDNHTAGERVEGADAVAHHIAGIFSGWPDLSFRTRRLYVREDFAACEWTASATAPDGRSLEWDGVDLFPLVDGRIARKDVYSSSGTPRVLGPAGNR
jgi:ketosteroid isomerase-like protein